MMKQVSLCIIFTIKLKMAAKDTMIWGNGLFSSREKTKKRTKKRAVKLKSVTGKSMIDSYQVLPKYCSGDCD